jgi:hypothetical protein
VVSPGTPVSSANKTDRQSSFVQKPESVSFNLIMKRYKNMNLIISLWYLQTLLDII